MAEVARKRLEMSDEEIDAFLATHRFARVASVAPDGEPTVSPVGYCYHGGRLWFYGMAKGRRMKDIEAGSRISVCIDDGVGEGESYSDRRGVVLYATARVVSDEDPVLDAVRPAYAQAQFGDSTVDFRRRTHAWIEATPYRTTSWDFKRIPAGADRFSS